MAYDATNVEYAMQVLYIAKSFYDHGRLDTLLGCFRGDVSIAPNNLGLIEAALPECNFEDTRYYCQRSQRSKRHGPYGMIEDRDTYVMRDPLLTRYDDLCRKLELKLGITKVENQFARDLESAIHRNMHMPSYNYDYQWVDSTREKKGAKIVLHLFEEFAAYYDIPYSLFSILDFCREGIPKLEAALAEVSEGKVIPLPIQPIPEKEAA